MFWPDNPQDAKALYLSLIGGLAVAIVIVSRDVMEILFGKELEVITTFTLFFVLWIMFIMFLNKYQHIREGLDDINVKSKKRK